jgi:outer membrane protein assembly factor BamB
MEVRQRRDRRGALAIGVSLLLLALCVCAFAGANALTKWPTSLRRYRPFAPGQAALYRLTSVDGRRGYVSENMAGIDSDTLGYLDAFIRGYGPRQMQQIRYTYTWSQEGEAVEVRDTFYVRERGTLSLIALAGEMATLTFDPPVPVWSPDLFADPAARIEGTTRAVALWLDGNRLREDPRDEPFRFRAQFVGDEPVSLPDGQAETARMVRLEIVSESEIVLSNVVWYVPRIGAVRRDDYDREGNVLSRADLIGSTRLAQSPLAPVSDLVGPFTGRRTFRENPARTGAHPEVTWPGSAVALVEVITTTEAYGDGYNASPLYANGVLYVANQLGHVMAFDAKTMTRRWQFYAGAPVVTTPAVADGVLYLGTGRKLIYALQAQHGLYLWHHHVSDHVTASPVVAEGMVLVGSEDGTLYALNAENGRRVWTFRARERIVGSPAIHQGRVFFGSNDGVVYALDLETGVVLWKYAMDAAIEVTMPISEKGLVYAASTGEQLVALNATTGKEVWTHYESRSGYIASPALGEQYLFTADQMGFVRAHDSLSGDLAWQWHHERDNPAFASSPLLVGRRLFAAYDGVIYVFDADSGVLHDRLTLETPGGYGSNGIVASPTWGDGRVYLTTQSGQIAVLETRP